METKVVKSGGKYLDIKPEEILWEGDFEECFNLRPGTVMTVELREHDDKEDRDRLSWMIATVNSVSFSLGVGASGENTQIIFVTPLDGGLKV